MKVTDRVEYVDAIQMRVVGDCLLELRENMGWTLTELCKIAEIDRDSYSKVEKGERNATLGVIVSVCNACNIKLSELFGMMYVERCIDVEKELEIDRKITDDFCRTVNRKKIICILKRMRKKLGMSQTIAAIEMGIPRTYLNNFEYGRAKVTPRLIKSLLNAFDIPLEQFLVMVDKAK